MSSWHEIEKKIRPDFAKVFKRGKGNIIIGVPDAEPKACDVVVAIERIFRMSRGLKNKVKIYTIDVEGTVAVRLDAGCTGTHPGYLTDCVELSELDAYEWQEEYITGGQASVSFRLRNLDVIEQNRTSSRYKITSGEIEQEEKK